MLLLYLDDAGSVNNAQEEYLVLGGVCVSEHQVNDLTHELDQLALGHDADPDAVEFHASAIYTGKLHPWDKLKKPEARREVLKEVLRIFRRSAAPACALACAVHKKSFAEKDPMELAFSELCNWFDGFLRTRHAAGCGDEKGMIFFDESTYETSLRRIARDFRRTGLAAGNSRYVVDVPHFVKSHETRCVQLADHVAYAVFRYYNAQDNNYLTEVLNRFQSDGRVLSGLRHLYADTAECTCPSCLTVRSSSGLLGKM